MKNRKPKVIHNTRICGVCQNSLVGHDTYLMTPLGKCCMDCLMLKVRTGIEHELDQMLEKREELMWLDPPSTELQ